MKGPHPLHGLIDRITEEEAESEGQVLSQQKLAPCLRGSLLVCSEELLNDPLAGQRGHSLMPFLAMKSMVRPLVTGCQISTGRFSGRGTNVTSFNG